MSKTWGSPFKFVDLITKTIKTAEDVIDKAIGIPEEQQGQLKPGDQNAPAPPPASPIPRTPASPNTVVSPQSQTGNSSFEWEDEMRNAAKPMPVRNTPSKDNITDSTKAKQASDDALLDFLNTPTSSPKPVPRASPATRKKPLTANSVGPDDNTPKSNGGSPITPRADANNQQPSSVSSEDKDKQTQQTNVTTTITPQQPPSSDEGQTNASPVADNTTTTTTSIDTSSPTDTITPSENGTTSETTTTAGETNTEEIKMGDSAVLVASCEDPMMESSPPDNVNNNTIINDTTNDTINDTANDTTIANTVNDSTQATLADNEGGENTPVPEQADIPQENAAKTPEPSPSQPSRQLQSSPSPAPSPSPSPRSAAAFLAPTDDNATKKPSSAPPSTPSSAPSSAPPSAPPSAPSSTPSSPLPSPMPSPSQRPSRLRESPVVEQQPLPDEAPSQEPKQQEPVDTNTSDITLTDTIPNASILANTSTTTNTEDNSNITIAAITNNLANAFDESTTNVNYATLTSNTNLEKENEKLALKVKELESKTHVLEVILKERERQLMVATAEAAQLNEVNQQLNNKMAQLEEVRNSSGTPAPDTNSLMEEFSKRLGGLEKKLLAVTKERDTLKKEMQSSANSVLIQQKDEEIATLRNEGEVLSKKQLTFEGTIKKLRSQATKDEALIKNLQERLSNTENLLESKVEKIRQLETSEKVLNESVANMKAVSEVSAKKMDEKVATAEKVQQMLSDLQAALDKANKELAEQKRLTAEANERADVARKDADAQNALELKQTITKFTRDAHEKESELTITIAGLRNALTAAEARAGVREDQMAKDIQELQEKLKAAEIRNSELVSTLSMTTRQATRPLLNELEALREANNERAQAWEATERSLLQRLKEEEMRAVLALENEHAAQQAQQELTLRVTALESQLSKERALTARLTGELEVYRNRCDDVTRSMGETQAQYNAFQHMHERMITTHKDNDAKTNALLAEYKAKEETRLAKKRQKQTAKINTMAQPSLNSSAESISDGATTPLSAGPSSSSIGGGGSLTPQQLDDEKQAMSREGSASSLPAMLLSSPMHGVGRLHNVLKQRDAELSTYIAQISALEKTRANLEDELVKLTGKNEDLNSKLEGLVGMEAQLKDLSSRHAAALEMMGEKQEQVEELKADILDMKTFYRAHISELLDNIEKLGGKVQR